LISEPPYDPPPIREKMTEIMIEKFHIPSMYVSINAVLSLHAAGKSTGLVVDSGAGVTHSVPIQDGKALLPLVRRTDVCGNDLDDYMPTLLHERGYYFFGTQERLLARDIKEKLGFVSLNFHHDITEVIPSSFAIKYELPDTQVVYVGNERFRCAEPLFKPLLLGINVPGLSASVHSSI